MLPRSGMSSPQRLNNFDLIRLLAAAQVVLAHAIGHTPLVHQLPPWGKALFDALMMLPGVPVFFVISGFLITQSFERNPDDWKGYFWRRGLRIFPGLWACLLITLAALAAFGFLTSEFVTSKTFAAWLAGQVSFFQFYNPEHFRAFGIGVANGALWTITVELQFYLFIPLFHWLVRASDAARAALSAVLFAVSFGLFCVMDHHLNGPGGYGGAPVPYKLLFVTLAPHLWMFLLGVAIHRHFDRLRPLITGKFAIWIAAYALVMWALHTLVDFRCTTYYLGYLPARLLLAMATISAAFSLPWLSQRLLRGNDISYGTYLYHSVVINVFVELGRLTTPWSVTGVFAVSILAALFSWHVVEKPALAMKNLLRR
jgi:peptidoglycan/LPS O-acetylase OafA/YrhL